MTFDTYLRILRDRLEESGVDAQTLQKTIEREKETLSGIASDDVESLFSEERLSVIIASAQRRSNNTVKDASTSKPAMNEQSTIVAHSSSLVEASTEIVTLAEEKTVLPVDLDKTAVVTPSTLPKSLLDSDTATVVISHTVIGRENRSGLESATTDLSSVKSDPLNKLLAESATVRISEKDTAEFFVADTDTTLIPSPSSEEVTIERNENAFKTPPSVKDHEETNLLSLIEEAHRQKKKRNFQDASIPVDPSISSAVTESDLKNAHPRLLLFCVLLVLLPCLVILLSAWSVFFVTGILILVFLLVFPIACYVLVVSFSGGGSIYGLYYFFSFLCQANYENSFKSIGFMLICTVVLVLSVMFLHRLVLPVYRYFLAKLRAFLRFHIVLCRVLYRSLLKNVKNI